ncbi:MAG: hypothetical protein JWO43_340 [Candidatus Adlerbacteria bacterium]|nr:hypothetical protein [Candidatus Adlerbacteria bacterium]
MSIIEKNVMAGVRMVYLGRTLVSRTALEAYVAVLSLWGIGRLVWVSEVFHNFVTVEKLGLAATGKYVLYALGHTQIGVQLTLLVLGAALLGLAVDAVRSATTPTRRFA